MAEVFLCSRKPNICAEYPGADGTHGSVLSFFEKSIDIPGFVWYNIDRKKERGNHYDKVSH